MQLLYIPFISRYGRVPLTWKEMLAGGPDLTQRIQMIAKALMLYNVWYPGKELPTSSYQLHIHIELPSNCR